MKKNKFHLNPSSATITLDLTLETTQFLAFQCSVLFHLQNETNPKDGLWLISLNIFVFMPFVYTGMLLETKQEFL